MRVIYTDRHRDHDPPHQFNVDHLGSYSESPARANAIVGALRSASKFDVEPPQDYDIESLHTVHDPGYVSFLQCVWRVWTERGKTSPLIPYTYGHRYSTHIPADIVHQAGYYCFDPQTPIVGGTFDAAWASARCALTAADLVLSGDAVAYALCRPPGHHAGRDVYGGYCYLNNAALAARRQGSRVAVLDIDYHHGNGTQSIFYADPDVFTVSIHADPDREYPFYTGAESEIGTGRGIGTNLNFALPSGVDDAAYLATLQRALDALDRFDPSVLIVSAGFDIYAGDPLGDFCVSLDGLGRIGSTIDAFGRPMVILQEGGYHSEDLGRCAECFLQAMG